MLFSPPLALNMNLVFAKMFDGTRELRSVPDGHRDVFQGRDELWLVLGRVVLWKKLWLEASKYILCQYLRITSML